MDTIKGLGALIGSILLVVVLFLFLDFTGILWDSKVGVWREDVRRNNYEHTKSYNQGKLQDLAHYFHEYNTSDEAGKSAVKSVVRQTFADYDTNLIQDEQLRAFLEQCRL